MVLSLLQSICLVSYVVCKGCGRPVLPYDECAKPVCSTTLLCGTKKKDNGVLAVQGDIMSLNLHVACVHAGSVVHKVMTLTLAFIIVFCCFMLNLPAMQQQAFAFRKAKRLQSMYHRTGSQQYGASCLFTQVGSTVQISHLHRKTLYLNRLTS